MERAGQTYPEAPTTHRVIGAESFVRSLRSGARLLSRVGKAIWYSSPQQKIVAFSIVVASVIGCTSAANSLVERGQSIVTENVPVWISFFLQ